MAGRSGGKTSVERLLAAIGYPERMSNGFAPFTLRVDGSEVVAEEMNGRVVLSCRLTDDASLLPTLATYSAGRMLKEEAALSYDEGWAILWQGASASADSHELRMLFETFMNSCDWWRARIDALHGNAEVAAGVTETMMIRP